MSPKIIYLQFEVTDLDAEVRLNDIPVGAGRRGVQRVQGVPAQEFLLRGHNVLTLDFGISGQPLPAGAAVLARVAAFEDDDLLDDSNGFTLAILRPKLSVDMPVPHRLTVDFEVFGPASIPASWSWSTAPSVAAAVSRSQLEAYAASLADLFLRADIDGLLAAFDVKLRERVRAYPVAPYEEAVAALRAEFEYMAELPSEFRAVDVADVTFRSAANGRLVELLDAAGGPFLRTRNAAPTARQGTVGIAVLPVMIGFHDRGLAILR